MRGGTGKHAWGERGVRTAMRNAQCAQNASEVPNASDPQDANTSVRARRGPHARLSALRIADCEYSAPTTARATQTGAIAAGSVVVAAAAAAISAKPRAACTRRGDTVPPGRSVPTAPARGPTPARAANTTTATIQVSTSTAKSTRHQAKPARTASDPEATARRERRRSCRRITPARATAEAPRTPGPVGRHATGAATTTMRATSNQWIDRPGGPASPRGAVITPGGGGGEDEPISGVGELDPAGNAGPNRHDERR